MLYYVRAFDRLDILPGEVLVIIRNMGSSAALLYGEKWFLD